MPKFTVIVFNRRVMSDGACWNISDHRESTRRLAAAAAMANYHVHKPYEIEAADHEDVFDKLNHNHPEDYRPRPSLSVGDIIVSDEQVVQVAPFGFEKLTLFIERRARNLVADLKEMTVEEARASITY